MRVLLDTHILLWWLSDDRRLKRSAREAIANERNEVYVSAVSVWEVAIKGSLGRIDVDVDEMRSAIDEDGFQTLTINTEHAARVARLPLIHRDPFDRMLIAQASIEELRVVTHDRVFERYGLRAEGLPPIFV